MSASRQRRELARERAVAVGPDPTSDAAEALWLVAGAPAVATEAGEPRCEMCGAAVIAAHCKRICLRCGFMTGCSEGI
ncbi:MAG TPA: hypothetical protein VII13_20660 [Vicinamibacteria bacterium]